MTQEEVKSIGSEVFNGDTSFEFINWEKDSFGLQIIIKNKIPTIDYIINVLEKGKRIGLLINYQPSFKYFTSTDDGFICLEISFYFFFEK